MTASAPRTIAFAIGGPITRADLSGLCERVCALLQRSGADVAICDVGGVEPDAVTVDALARLQLAAAATRVSGAAAQRVGASCATCSRSWGCATSFRNEAGYDSTRGGSPKSGNSASVPRKNVNSTIRPREISSTWSAQGSKPSPVSLGLY